MSRELRHAVIAACLWSVLVAVGGVMAFRFANRHVFQLALYQARALFSTIVDAREWNATHGGVYAPVSEQTVPNPYLDHAHRDVTTTEGQELTLINPAFMTRQVAEFSENRDVRIHITSLKPLRPANAAGPWEGEALLELESGIEEYSTFAADPGGERVFRFMAPLITSRACLACHEKQGYDVGDVRGGISVTFPAQPFVAARANLVRTTVLVSAVVWMLGGAVILAAAHTLGSRRRALERAQEMSHLDSLTKLHNRRGFMSLSSQSLASIARRNGKAVLAYVDIDGFKEINDRFGHDEGDLALQRLAEALRTTCRASDVVARLGGDEFILLLLDASWQDWSATRSRLAEALRRSNQAATRPYELTVSIGTVEFDPEAPIDLDDLVRAADRAMYEEKRLRRSSG